MRLALFLAGLVFAVVTAVTGQAAHAQAYPQRPIRLIVPWPPGGGSDLLMRAVADALEPRLGQPVTPVNIPGLSGTTGLRTAARSLADGYTITQIHEGLQIAHKTGLTDLDWKDFEPVALLAGSPQYLVVRADSGWRTLEDFAAAARAAPRGVLMGVTLGGVPHLHAAMIEDALDVEFAYAGYEGTRERLAALRDGDVGAVVGDIASAGPYVETGELRFLAVGSAERLALSPDVPTFAELGYDLELSVTRGIVMPKDAPEEACELLETALRELSQDKAFVAKLQELGVESHFRGHEAYLDHLEKMDAVIDRVIRRLN